MTMFQILLVAAGLMALMVVGYTLLAGPSAAKESQRRLQAVRFRHSDSASAKMESQLKKAIAARKAAGLLQLIVHLRRFLGTKGVASARGSAIEASDSAMKLTGRSGLSRAARPILAQYST